MTHQKREFTRFPVDSDRVIANLDAAYGQWIDARQRLEAMPSSMFWQRKGDVDYLAVKEESAGSATTVGARSPSTEFEYNEFHTEKNALRDSIKTADELIAQRAAQYRALRLPVLGDKQAELLRALDVEGLLRNDLLIVGTNAFSAYEILCGVKFPVGNEETEDFELAWCRDSKVSVSRAPVNPSQANRPKRRSLLTVLQKIDATYKINPRKPYQAVNAAGYEVELLAAPSLCPLPANEAFKPMVTLIEQEWLLRGVLFLLLSARFVSAPVPCSYPIRAGWRCTSCGCLKNWSATQRRNPKTEDKVWCCWTPADTSWLTLILLTSISYSPYRQSCAMFSMSGPQIAASIRWLTRHSV